MLDDKEDRCAESYQEADTQTLAEPWQHRKPYFKGVPEEVWNFHIGGYQVCEKWLKDRQAKGGKNPAPAAC